MAFGSLRRLLRLGSGEVVGFREGYALWADTYPPWAHNPLMQAEAAVTRPLITAAVPRRALDVGTGTGRNITLLAESGARHIVAVDLSMAMLARQGDATPRICADAGCLPFAGGMFDTVCASLMAGDLPDVGAFVNEAARVLAPGGQLVYSDFHPAWRTEGWRRTFRAGRRLVELAFYPHTIDHHLQRIAEAGLAVRTIREPRIAGRAAPVVAVFHAVKPGPPLRPRR